MPVSTGYLPQDLIEELINKNIDALIKKRDESDAKDAIIDSLKAKCHSLDSQLYAMMGGEEGESARSQNEMTTLPTKTDIVTQFKEKHDIDNIPS